MPIDGNHLDQIIKAILALMVEIKKEVLEGLVKIATEQEKKGKFTSNESKLDGSKFDETIAERAKREMKEELAERNALKMF